jgi:hypothetical protein
MSSGGKNPLQLGTLLTFEKPCLSWGMGLHVYNPSYWEVEVGGSRSEVNPGKIVRPYLKSKFLKAERGGGIVQVGEHLPSKLQTLSSNPNT